MMITRNSSPEVFCTTGALKNFTKCRGKHLHRSRFFNEIAGHWGCWDFIKKETGVLRTTFLKTPYINVHSHRSSRPTLRVALKSEKSNFQSSRIFTLFYSTVEWRKENLKMNFKVYKEAYSGPCQTSNMRCFAKVVNTEAATRNVQQKTILKIFAIFTGKYQCWSLLYFPNVYLHVWLLISTLTRN